MICNTSRISRNRRRAQRARSDRRPRALRSRACSIRLLIADSNAARRECVARAASTVATARRPDASATTARNPTDGGDCENSAGTNHALAATMAPTPPLAHRRRARLARWCAISSRRGLRLVICLSRPPNVDFTGSPKASPVQGRVRRRSHWAADSDSSSLLPIGLPTSLGPSDRRWPGA